MIPSLEKLISAIKKDFTYNPLSHEVRSIIVDTFRTMNCDGTKAYEQFKIETYQQFMVFKELVDVIPYTEEMGPYPYTFAHEMIEDVKKNGRIIFFPTNFGFGGLDDDMDFNHPLLELSPILCHGYQMYYNDIFRVTHDLFTHVMYDLDFFCEGEEAAWMAHSQFYSPLAQRALFTETIGQSTAVFLNSANTQVLNELCALQTVYTSRPNTRSHLKDKASKLADKIVYAEQKYTVPDSSFVYLLYSLIG